MSNSVGIKNDRLAVHRLIKDVKPHTVWFRELLKNAIEATLSYISNNNVKIPAKIKVRGLPLYELLTVKNKIVEHTQPKLSILNLGGMSVTKLNSIIQLFSSGDEKVQDHLKNFGIGMKLVEAKFTDVLIITKFGTEVYMLIFGLDRLNGLVIKQKATDVTEWAELNAVDRGYNMDHDWTEVILLGKGEQNWLTQNTVKNTFSDKTGNAKNIALQQAYERFVDIPKNIEIVFEAGVNGDSTPHNGGVKSGNVVFKTKEEMFERGVEAESKVSGKVDAFVETVEHNGFKFHLRYDAPRSKDQEPVSRYSESRQTTTSSFGGLIWGEPDQRERYGIVKGNSWISVASAVGILNDQKYFTVDIELPYAEYEPLTDRTGVVLREHLADFANWEDHEPATFKKLIPDLKEAIQKSIKFKEKVLEHNEKNPPMDIKDLMKEMMDDYYTALKKFAPDTGTNATNKNSSDGIDSSGNQPGKMPIVPYTGNELSCPGCRKNKVITKLPRGTKICPVCGYERKTAGNNGHKKPANEPIYPQMQDNTSIDDYALVSSEEVIQVNPKHYCVEKLYNNILREKPEYADLPQDLKDDIKYHCHKVISAEIGVKTMIARLMHLKDSEWLDAKKLEAKLDSVSLTLDALETHKFVEKVLPYAKKVFKRHQGVAELVEEV